MWAKGLPQLYALARNAAERLPAAISHGEHEYIATLLRVLSDALETIEANEWRLTADQLQSVRSLGKAVAGPRSVLTKQHAVILADLAREFLARERLSCEERQAFNKGVKIISPADQF